MATSWVSFPGLKLRSRIPFDSKMSRGWAYFSFGHVEEAKYAKTAKAFPAAACNSCHESSADTDFVFTQYYPVLRAAMPKHKLKAADEARNQTKKLDQASLRAAMGAVGESSEAAKADDYAMKIFGWLQKKGYKDYKAESAVHPSSSGAAVHGDVRTFVNDKLDASMRADNAGHLVGSWRSELYKDGEMYGWAAAVKTRDDDGKGNGWYWYEVISKDDGSKPVAASLGNTMCVGCHAAGNDYIRTGKIK